MRGAGEAPFKAEGGDRKMRRTSKLIAIPAAALVLGLSACAALAEDVAEGEFGGECVMGLALGKDIQTDCSVNTVYKGKTYCFGNETARDLFLKRPEDFLLQAHIYYSSKQDAEQKP
jgi:YHS domain-containing protein